MLDPITAMVEQIMMTLVRPEQVELVDQQVNDRVLQITVRFKTRGASGWVIGRGGESIDRIRWLARRASDSRSVRGQGGGYADVRISIEHDAKGGIEAG